MPNDYFANDVNPTYQQVVACGSASKDKLVSVIAIVSEHQHVLLSFLDEVSQVLSANYHFFEIVLIDNHSSDGSFDVVRRQTEKQANLRLLRLSRHHHREVALAAGIEHCVGDYAIIMDINRDRATDIPRMVKEAENGADVVIARHAKQAPISRMQSLGYRMTSAILQQQIDPQATYFRLFSRRAIGAMSKIRQRRRFLKYFSAMVGFRQVLIETQAHPRTSVAESRHQVFELALRAIDIVFSHTAFPLRVMAFLGITASLGNLAYLVYVVVVTLVKNEIAEGWLTTSVMIGSMFLMLFAMLTVFAEYIARIYEEVKDQPLYFIETELESHLNTRPQERPLNVA